MHPSRIAQTANAVTRSQARARLTRDDRILHNAGTAAIHKKHQYQSTHLLVRDSWVVALNDASHDACDSRLGRVQPVEIERMRLWRPPDAPQRIPQYLEAFLTGGWDNAGCNTPNGWNTGGARLTGIHNEMK